MLRSGSIAAMILVAVALLAGLVSAGPLFASATGYAGLVRRLATIPASDSPAHRPVVQVTVQDPMEKSEPKVRSLITDIPYLDPPTTTIIGNSAVAEGGVATPYVLVGGVRLPAILYYRSAALAGLQVVSGTPGAPGLWLSESTAESLKVKAGSRVQVGKTYRWVVPSCGAPFFKLTGRVKGTDTEAGVPVAGIYRTTPDGRTPLGPYFSRISSSLPSDPGRCLLPAVLMIGDQPTINNAIAAINEEPLWSASAELSTLGRSPDHLRLAAAGAARLRTQATEPNTPINEVLNLGARGAQVVTGLPDIEQQAARDADAARDQGRGIGYAGGVLGLAAVIVGLRALSQRRRRETELLLGLGTPTSIVVAAGLLELLLPAVFGAAAGFGVACLAFDRVGPHPGLDPAAVRAAALAAALVAGVTLLSNALVTLAQARQISRSLSGLPASRLAAQWLPMLTGATVLAVIATLTRDRNQSYQDPLSALLPILVLACGCAVLVQGAGAVGALVQRLRRQDEPPSAVRWAADRLVLRGLRGTGVAVADLVLVLSIGIGVLAYGLISAAVVDKSVADKAAVLAGANSSAHIRHSWLLGGGDGPAPRLATGTTVVWRALGELAPDNRDYDILVVNPATLRAAASWGSGPELAAARAALSDFGTPTRAQVKADAKAQNPIPALLVGPSDRAAGTTALLTADLVHQPIKILDHLTAFPGAVRPTLVLDSRSFFTRLTPDLDPSHHARALDNYDTESNFIAWAWTRDNLASLRRLMLAHGVPVQETSTLAQAQATPVLASGRWAASYQVLLGLAAAALAGLAVVVAVDRRVARAAPVDLMLKRFGIPPSRLLALRTIELALTGLAALLVLAAPLVVMLVLLPRLIEPDPAVPPGLVVRGTALPLLLSAAVAGVIAVVAALAAARRSAALRPGEVLRDDG
jgi:putative ABC transport system permease protein